MSSAATIARDVTIPQLGPWEASFLSRGLVAACKAYIKAACADMDELIHPEMTLCLSSRMMRLTPRPESYLDVAVPSAEDVSLKPFDAVDLRVLPGQLLAAAKYVWTMGGSPLYLRWDDSAPRELRLTNLPFVDDLKYAKKRTPVEMNIRCRPLLGVHGLSLVSYNNETGRWEKAQTD